MSIKVQYNRITALPVCVWRSRIMVQSRGDTSCSRRTRSTPTTATMTPGSWLSSLSASGTAGIILTKSSHSGWCRSFNIKVRPVVSRDLLLSLSYCCKFAKLLESKHTVCEINIFFPLREYDNELKLKKLS